MFRAEPDTYIGPKSELRDVLFGRRTGRGLPPPVARWLGFRRRRRAWLAPHNPRNPTICGQFPPLAILGSNQHLLVDDPHPFATPAGALVGWLLWMRVM
jgi:hypothetical protein